MRSRSSTLSGYLLATFATALTFHPSAQAEDRASPTQSTSVQEAMQDILTGKHRLHPAAAMQAANIGSVKSTASVQEVLLGASRLRVDLTEATARTGGPREPAAAPDQARHSPAGIQAAVQRMLGAG